MKKEYLFLLFLCAVLTILSIYIFSTQKYKKSGTSQPVTIPKRQISKGDIPSIPFTLPQGFTIHIFAHDISQARDITFSPSGTLLVSSPNTGSIFALPDKNHDGASDEEKMVIGNLSHPHGIAFYKNNLYVATTTQVLKFHWDEKTLTASDEKQLFSLPQNTNHTNRTIIFDNRGTMYVSVGSTCNVCFESAKESATIMVSNENGDNPHIFASGLRNAPFMAFNPITNALWVTEMGRDYLGDSTPSDEIDIIKNGKNYGWPLCYGNKIHDTQFDKKVYKINPCDTTQSPLYEIPAHSAPLGLTFIHSVQFPQEWQNDLLIAYHGSWNRSKPVGYNVVHLTIKNNTVTNASDFLTGFISHDAKSGNDAFARPVDLEFDTQGNLYISDDKTGSIYIIQENPK